jgi:hypothetical protein
VRVTGKNTIWGKYVVARYLLAVLFLAALGPWKSDGLGGPKDEAPQGTEVSASRRLPAEYARLPLSFERNLGQTDRRVKFLARGPHYTLFLTSDEAVLALQQNGARQGKPGAPSVPPAVVRVRLVGANDGAQVSGLDELPGRSNYFVGNDPQGWHTQIPTYAKVLYRNAYPGIDAVYYGRQGQMETDYVVKPGGDAGLIRMGIEGAQKLEVDREGNLVLQVDGGAVRFERPVAYQENGGRRSSVAAHYALAGQREVKVEVGQYDHRSPLIIDPVLIYSTYLGGTGGDVAYGIAVDSSGNAFITGITNSADFPTVGASQSASAGNGDAFVAELNAAGTALVYSTYLGGNGADTGYAIAVAASGDAFVTGTTTSTNFPAGSSTTAFQATYGGNGDAFVTQLNSTGNKLVYSSYLGGQGADFGQGIAVDSAGNAYVTGSTQSVDFPVVGPLQSTSGGGSDVFVAKVNFTGSALLYSTYLGGSAADVGQAIQVDSSGSAYIAGYTFSTNFPTHTPYQGGNAGGGADAFVAKLSPSGTGLVYSTYLGGNGDDRAFGVALDSSGDAFVAGETQSTNFPTTSSALQITNHGGSDAFVTKLNPGGTNLVYSTLLGGSAVDQANGIAVDATGDAFVTGFTQSSDFPTQQAVQGLLGITGGSACGTNPCADSFISELNPAGTTVTYSTFLGGSGADFGQAIALDSTGNAYVTGSTASTNFPAIAGAFQGVLRSVAGNAFIAKIGPSNLPAIALVPSKLNFGNQSLNVRSPAQTITVVNEGTAPLDITTITPTGDFQETDNCIGTVSGSGGSCSINVTYTPSVLGAVPTNSEISVTDNAFGSPHLIPLSGAGISAATAVTLSSTSLSFGNQNVGTIGAAQTVTITNTGTSTLVINSITASTNFVQTNTCGAALNTLNVGQNCSVSVSFQPTASGALSGTLSVSDNASGSPQNVVLSGTGLAVFSIAAASATATIPIGTTSVNYTISASGPSGFGGNISFACSTGITCTFSPTTILAGQSTTMTVSGLSASTPNPYTFTVAGTSGSQSTSIPLTVLTADFTMSASPALDTIVSGGTATYTVVVTPSNGFNQQVNLSCLSTSLPPGGKCSFTQASVTPSGSPVSVSLSVTTNKTGSVYGHRHSPFNGAPPPFALWLAGLAVLFGLTEIWRRRHAEPERGRRHLSLSWRLTALGTVMAVLIGLSACRPSGTTANAATTTGNYTITIVGTLSSNATVTRTFLVNLSVT